MLHVRKKEKNVTAIQVKCSQCGHINDIQKDTPYLFDTVNTRYCDICKSKEVDCERVY